MTCFADHHRPVAAGLEVHDLGHLDYGTAYDLQKRHQAEVIATRQDPTPRDAGRLLLVEHDPPVITVSRRKGARDHLVATEAQLARAGVTVAETDRGGDITYHGPGQLVGYPILDLNRLGLRLHGYMRFLEQIIIDTLATFGVDGHRDECATGVWVTPAAGPDAKICAMGVRVSRWVSMHGFALNVDPDLSHFSLIVPCGLAGRPVTSMRTLLGDACPSMDEVKRVTVKQFDDAVRVAMTADPADGDSTTT